MKISLGMELMFTIDSINTAAETFIQRIEGKKVVAFHGEMGAGKTTFIHAVCAILGITDSISSPTFSIINEYQLPDKSTVFHMDLYRVNSEAEAVNAGVEDCIMSGNLCFVEWPDRTPGLFPPETVHCFLESVSDNTRKLRINL